MIPTKGRVIFYWHPGDPEPLGAFVAGVDPSKTDGAHLHLVLFDPVAGLRVVRGVQAGNEGTGEGQWHWPPRGAVLEHGNQAHLAVPTPDLIERYEAAAKRLDEAVARAELLVDTMLGDDKTGEVLTGTAASFVPAGDGSDDTTPAPPVVEEHELFPESVRRDRETLEQQIRKDIQEDPVAYGDEKNIPEQPQA